MWLGRGVQVRFAQLAGAVAVIVYDDVVEVSSRVPAMGRGPARCAPLTGMYMLLLAPAGFARFARVACDDSKPGAFSLLDALTFAKR